MEKLVKLMLVLFVLTAFSCNRKNNVECIKSDSNQFAFLLKQNDSELFETLIGFESYLLDSNYLQNTTKNGYVNLLDNLTNDDINIPVFEYYNRNADPMELISPTRLSIIDKCISNIKPECGNDYLRKLEKILSIMESDSIEETGYLNELEEEFFQFQESRLLILMYTWYIASDTYYK